MVKNSKSPESAPATQSSKAPDPVQAKPAKAAEALSTAKSTQGPTTSSSTGPTRASTPPARKDEPVTGASRAEKAAGNPSKPVAAAKPAAEPTRSAAPTATGSQPVNTTAGGTDRLAARQLAECGASGSLGRTICNERVRLRFCRERWNKHPDCRLEHAANGQPG